MTDSELMAAIRAHWSARALRVYNRIDLVIDTHLGDFASCWFLDHTRPVHRWLCESGWAHTATLLGVSGRSPDGGPTN